MTVQVNNENQSHQNAHKRSTERNPNERKYLTIEEQKELIKISSRFPRHKLIVLLLMHGGLRVTEAVSLKVSDIDFKNRIIRVKSLKKRKGEVYRDVPMSNAVYDEVLKYISNTNVKSDGYLIHNHGKPITRNAVNKFLKIYEQESDLLAGTRLHPHKLRHTFASMMRANSAEIEDIRDTLGHENIQTTLIYAHSDPKKLHELVNASTAPSTPVTFINRIKNAVNIFKKKPVVPKRKITQNNQHILIGRKSEKERVITLLSKSVNTIILGGTGVGKSYLLEQCLQMYTQTHGGKVLEFDDTKNFKKQLANTVLFLLKGDKEKLKEVMFGDIEEDSLRVKISKESTINIAKILCQITSPKEYVLSINDLDGINVNYVKALQELVHHFVIIGTARSIPINRSDFLWDFEKVEINNLKRADAMALIYRLAYGLSVDDFRYLKTAVYEASNGNPRMIVQLINRMDKEEYLDTDTINEITETYIGREIKQIDMSVYLLLLFGGIAVLRYLSGEVGNESLRFIGGCSMIFVLFARYFFNSFKRKNI